MRGLLATFSGSVDRLRELGSAHKWRGDVIYSKEYGHLLSSISKILLSLSEPTDPPPTESPATPFISSAHRRSPAPQSTSPTSAAPESPSSSSVPPYHVTPPRFSHDLSPKECRVLAWAVAKSRVPTSRSPSAALRGSEGLSTLSALQRGVLIRLWNLSVPRLHLFSAHDLTIFLWGMARARCFDFKMLHVAVPHLEKLLSDQDLRPQDFSALAWSIGRCVILETEDADTSADIQLPSLPPSQVTSKFWSPLRTPAAVPSSPPPTPNFGHADPVVFATHFRRLVFAFCDRLLQSECHFSNRHLATSFWGIARAARWLEPHASPKNSAIPLLQKLGAVISPCLPSFFPGEIMMLLWGFAHVNLLPSNPLQVAIATYFQQPFPQPKGPNAIPPRRTLAEAEQWTEVSFVMSCWSLVSLGCRDVRVLSYFCEIGAIRWVSIDYMAQLASTLVVAGMTRHATKPFFDPLLRHWSLSEDLREGKCKTLALIAYVAAAMGGEQDWLMCALAVIQRVGSIAAERIYSFHSLSLMFLLRSCTQLLEECSAVGSADVSGKFSFMRVLLDGVDVWMTKNRVHREDVGRLLRALAMSQVHLGYREGNASRCHAALDGNWAPRSPMRGANTGDCLLSLALLGSDVWTKVPAFVHFLISSAEADFESSDISNMSRIAYAFALMDTFPLSLLRKIFTRVAGASSSHSLGPNWPTRVPHAPPLESSWGVAEAVGQEEDLPATLFSELAISYFATRMYTLRGDASRPPLPKLDDRVIDNWTHRAAKFRECVESEVDEVADSLGFCRSLNLNVSLGGISQIDLVLVGDG